MSGIQSHFLLQFEELVTRLHSLPGSVESQQFTLAVGVGSLVDEVLRHSPPKPLEIEQAIELVEDAVMPVRAQLPEALQLSCADPQLRLLCAQALSVPDGDANVSEATARWLEIDAVEHLFNRLVARAEGRPASQDVMNVEGANVARLVILREILHHWGLGGLYLTV